MIRNLLLHLLIIAGFSLLLTACDNDDKDGNLSASYSNKLSAPDGGNLTLTYSSRVLIGKDVYFKKKDSQHADMTLFGILPGEPKTTIENMAIQPGNDSYTFTGNATGTNGTTFRYEGSIGDGKMTLNLTDVAIPSSSLTSQEKWYIVHSAPGKSPVYNGVGGPGGSTSSLIGMLYSLVLNNMLGNAISSVLDEVSFKADGNITAAYAPLPDDVTIGSLIAGNGVTGRPASDWQQSPLNLAFYYVKNNTDLYVVPNIDMIIYQVQLNKSTKAGEGEGGLATAIAQLYERLNNWSTKGIKLAIRPAETSNADLLLVLEKEEIEDLFLLLDIAKAIIPAETLNQPVSEALSGIIPPEYAPLLDLFLNGKTLGETLDLLHKELNTMPIEIGLYLSKKQTYN